MHYDPEWLAQSFRIICMSNYDVNNILFGHVPFNTIVFFEEPLSIMQTYDAVWMWLPFSTIFLSKYPDITCFFGHVSG